MGFFSGITAKVTSITASLYMVRRLADSLPERIEAFKNGDYVTAFLGEKIGSLFKHEEDEQTKTVDETELIPSSDVPELTADVKAAMGYDDLVTESSAKLAQLQSAAMVSDEEFISTELQLQQEAYVDTYMNMVLDPNFQESDFYKTMNSGAMSDQFAILVDFQKQIAAGTLTADELRNNLLTNAYTGGTGAYNPDLVYTLSDGTQMPFPPIVSAIAGSYEDVYLGMGESVQAEKLLSTEKSTNYLSREQTTLDAAETSFITGHSVDNVLTIRALQLSDVRNAVANQYDDTTKQTILTSDYHTPLLADTAGWPHAVAHSLRENDGMVEQARSEHRFLKYDITSGEYSYAEPSTYGAFHAAVDKVSNQQPQRDPALQAETEELANIGQTTTVDTSYDYQ